MQVTLFLFVNVLAYAFSLMLYAFCILSVFL